MITNMITSMYFFLLLPTVVLNDEEKGMIEALNAALSRYDLLIGEVTDPSIRAENRAFSDTYKDRRDVLRKAFDQTKYDELRDALNIAHQRLISWLRPPLLLPPTAKEKPKPQTHGSLARAEPSRFSIDVLPSVRAMRLERLQRAIRLEILVVANHWAIHTNERDR